MTVLLRWVLCFMVWFAGCASAMAMPQPASHNLGNHAMAAVATANQGHAPMHMAQAHMHAPQSVAQAVTVTQAAALAPCHEVPVVGLHGIGNNNTAAGQASQPCGKVTAHGCCMAWAPLHRPVLPLAEPAPAVHHARANTRWMSVAPGGIFRPPRLLQPFVG